MDAKDFGKKIQSLRKQRGLSQEELAAKSGVARRALQRIESGSGNPTVDTIKSLATVLEFDPFQTEQKEPMISEAMIYGAAKKAVMEALVMSPARHYGAEIPPEVAANWQKAGTTRQLLCLYLLTGEDQYKRALKPELKSRLEDIAQYVHLKRSPAKKAR